MKSRLNVQCLEETNVHNVTLSIICHAFVCDMITSFILRTRNPVSRSHFVNIRQMSLHTRVLTRACSPGPRRIPNYVPNSLRQNRGPGSVLDDYDGWDVALPKIANFDISSTETIFQIK